MPVENGFIKQANGRSADEDLAVAVFELEGRRRVFSAPASIYLDKNQQVTTHERHTTKGSNATIIKSLFKSRFVR